MKTILLILILLGMNGVFAQTAIDGTPVVNPPGSVLASYNKTYSHIKNPRWEVDGNYYVAQYTELTLKKSRRIVYDTQGNVICMDTEIDCHNCPACIGEYCNKKYPKQQHQIWTSKDSKGVRTYYTKQEKNIVRFDKDGKYISTTPIPQPEKELISIK